MIPLDRYGLAAFLDLQLDPSPFWKIGGGLPAASRLILNDRTEGTFVLAVAKHWEMALAARKLTAH